MMGYWSPLGQGLGHFWFVTIIMICYLFVPIANAVYNDIPWFRNNIWFVLLAIVAVLEPYLLFYNMNFGNIVVFFIGFFFARKQIRMTHKLFIFSILTMFVLSLMRILTRSYLDNTVIYNYYISGLATTAIGLGIVMTVFYLRFLFPDIIDRISTIKVIVWLESIIYEFYLIHHVIIKGSWSFYKFGYNPILTTIVILIVTVCLSLLLKSVTNLLVSKIFK